MAKKQMKSLFGGSKETVITKSDPRPPLSPHPLGDLMDDRHTAFDTRPGRKVGKSKDINLPTLGQRRKTEDRHYAPFEEDEASRKMREKTFFKKPLRK